MAREPQDLDDPAQLQAISPALCGTVHLFDKGTQLVIEWRSGSIVDTNARLAPLEFILVGTFRAASFGLAALDEEEAVPMQGAHCQELSGAPHSPRRGRMVVTLDERGMPPQCHSGMGARRSRCSL